MSSYNTKKIEICLYNVLKSWLIICRHRRVILCLEMHTCRSKVRNRFISLVAYYCREKSFSFLIEVPEEAVNAFEIALRQNPSDPLLASKLGRAYVKTHQYDTAIDYYKDAIARDRNSTLKLDLAELYLKLKQFSNAEQLLIDDINANEK